MYSVWIGEKPSLESWYGITSMPELYPATTDNSTGALRDTGGERDGAPAPPLFLSQAARALLTGD